VASGFATFPIVLETVRECLQDAYDVPALRSVLTRLRDGDITVHEVATEHPSPFAQSLLFGYVASFLYEGDSPLAERRAQALTLDTQLLAELLGSPELRDLLDAGAIAEVEAELQRLTPRLHARDVEDAADFLRLLGPLSDEAAHDRGIDAAWLAALRSDRRAIEVRIGGHTTTAAIEDAGRLRDAFGIALPVGIPDAHLAPVADPLGDLVGRYARTHGPFTMDGATADLGLAPAVSSEVVGRLVGAGRLLVGAFRPGGQHTEYCDPEVLRRVRRRTIARLRDEIEPVGQAAYAAFLPSWQHVARLGERPDRRGADGCFEVIEQLAGCALPASAWQHSVFASRVADFHPGLIDELTTAGDVVWWGVSALPGGDGIVCLAPRAGADGLRAAPPVDPDPLSPVAEAVIDCLAAGGAYFFRDVADSVGRTLGTTSDNDILEALWSLVWSSRVTNDSWGALRSRLSAPASRPTPTRRGRRPAFPARSGPSAGAGRWSALRQGSTESAERARLVGDSLLERYGIVTRGSVVSERLPGGFAAAYRVLAAFEDAGRCQRVYAIEGLGAAQFALPVAVDRMRAATGPHDPEVVVLAATDPANAYGAAIPWPPLTGLDVTHRPGRKAGATIVLVDGRPALYLEKGGRSLLAWPMEDDALSLAASGLLGAPVARPAVIERVNGRPIHEERRIVGALSGAGFVETPKGYRAPRAR
jgi:ATP-dependent Lhr-like helicase